MKEKEKKIAAFITENIPEIALILGLFFICLAAFLVNFILGFLVIGIELVVMGVFLAKPPKK